MKTKESKPRKPRFLGRYRTFNLIGGLSLSSMMLLILGLLATVSPRTSSALSNASDTAVSRVSVHNAVMVGIALDSRVDIDATPTSTGTFAIGNTTLGITTNNPEGYKIFLSSVVSNQLIGANGRIDSIADSTVGTAFAGNTWGYNLEPGTTEATEYSTYHAVPTSTQEIYNEPSAIASEELYNYNLAFGVHITPSLMAGEYSNNIIVSVVANPNTISSLEDLVYMQDMTPEICENTLSAYNHDTNTTDKTSPYFLNPITKQLYDLRDGNKYWVAKLADGNCWMTQNLALNLGERPENAPDYYSRYIKTLTPADSDVSEDWTVPASITKYKTYSKPGDISSEVIEATETISGTEVEIPRMDTRTNTELKDVVRSWNLGKLVVSNPTGNGVERCAQSLPEELQPLGYTEGNPNNNSTYFGYKIADKCPQFIKDTEQEQLIASNEPIATDETTIIDNKYDTHYLLGNYYTWSAATAQTGLVLSTNVTAGQEFTLNDATGSICPSGWRLSVGGTNRASNQYWPLDRPDSAYRLLRAYGYPETGQSTTDPAGRLDGWYANNAKAYTGVVSSDGVRVDLKPIYHVHGGVVAMYTGSIRSLGIDGGFWMSTSFQDNQTSAYQFAATKDNVYASNHNGKLGGFNVRCLAR